MIKLSFRKIQVLIQVSILCLMYSGQMVKGSQTEEWGLNQENELSFNEALAWDLLLAQEQIGYRFPGSDGQQQTQTFIENYFMEYSDWHFEKQDFEYKGVQVSNLIAEKECSNQSAKWLLLGAHYDTRARADHDPVNTSTPVMGANDGASGVAVLLELARALSSFNFSYPLRLIFFDAEDQGSGGIDGWDWIVGSNYYVSSLLESEKEEIEAFVLLDMIGDEDLDIYWEKNSNINIREEIWSVADSLGYSQFISAEKYRMIDDHVPFLNAGIPAVDLIDFDYPYWHTRNDTSEHCSSSSLFAVGQTIEKWLFDKNGTINETSTVETLDEVKGSVQLMIVVFLPIVLMKKKIVSKKKR